MNVAAVHRPLVARPSLVRRALSRVAFFVGVFVLALSITLGLYDHSSDRRPNALPLVALSSGVPAETNRTSL